MYIFGIQNKSIYTATFKTKFMVNIKNVIIDVDVIIEKWNKKNPDSKNPMSRKRLAKLIGKTEQTLSLWKVGTTPKLIYTLYQLMEIGECKLNDFIKPEK